MASQSTEKKKDRFEKVKNEKRSLYLIAAVKTFQERGFHATTVKDITDEAGTSVGNFYRYFDSKEKIFEELITTFHKVLVEKLHVLNVPGQDIPPVQVLTQLFHDYAQLFKKNKEIGLIYIEQMGGISKEYREMHTRLQDVFDSEVEKIITRIFNAIKQKGQHPRINAIAWTHLFLESFSWWARTEYKMPEDEFVDSIVHFLVLGTMTVPRPPRKTNGK